MRLSEQKKNDILMVKANLAFSPTSPITKEDMFKGRKNQLGSAIQGINQIGQHIIVYGERGVGKTSLVRVLGDILDRHSEQFDVFSYSTINCNKHETFSSLWRKIAAQVEWGVPRDGIGITAQQTIDEICLSHYLPGVDSLTPNDIVETLIRLNKHAVFIFDEFDKLPDPEKAMFADLIKALSDNSTKTTVILVGVADNIHELIGEHASIERAMRQILLPRMGQDEIVEILDNAEAIAGIRFSQGAKDKIVQVSQGLPFFVHQIGIQSVIDCVNQYSTDLTVKNVENGIKDAVSNAEQSLKDAYHKATLTQKKESLYKQVLLACALTPKDHLGYFKLSDVAPCLGKILGKHVKPSTYSPHIHEFLKSTRGPALMQRGESHINAYRFKNSMLQPFVIMDAISRGINVDSYECEGT